MCYKGTALYHACFLLFQAENFGNSFVMEMYVEKEILDKIDQAVSTDLMDKC